MSKVITQEQLGFDDVLIAPRYGFINSRKNVNLLTPYNFKHSMHNKWIGVPIIGANMDTVGTIELSNHMSKHHCMTALHKHYSEDELINFFKNPKTDKDLELLLNNQHHLEHSFYSMGISDAEFEKLNRVIDQVGYWQESNLPSEDSGLRFVCIDVANGYMQNMVDFCRKVKEKHPSLTIMAGNVVSSEMVRVFDSVGVDIVKVGIGSGSVCTTRKIAGVGRPQLSAILDCAEEADKCGIYIASDGGCTVPGDVAKAFAAGASFVMLGGMLAGHKESGLKSIVQDGKTYYEYYGMSSGNAMNKHAGSVADYRAEEGKRVLLKDKGSLDKTLQSILGGVRSACTYVGADDLSLLNLNSHFYKSNIQTNDVYGKE